MAHDMGSGHAGHNQMSGHEGHGNHAGSATMPDHNAHGGHGMMVADFRRRFRISLILTILFSFYRR